MSLAPSEEALAQQIGEALGFVPNVFRAAEPHPEAQRALWLAFRHLVLSGALPRTLKEMMGVLVSLELGSGYAAELQLHGLGRQDLEESVLDALRTGEVPRGFSPKVTALLAFAVATARTPGDPTPLEGLRKAGLDEVEVIEAVMVVGLFQMIGIWTNLMVVPADAR